MCPPSRRRPGWLSQEQLLEVVCVQNSRGAFAALRSDGSLVAWGAPHGGGSCSAAVREALRRCGGVRSVQASYAAFAAIGRDETVVSWGDTEKGGDDMKECGCLG